MKFRLFISTVLFVLFAALSAKAQGLLNTGVRPLGMGGTFTVIADDANAVFWNPAGLPFLKRGEINFMHDNLYDTGISHVSVGLSYPVTGATAVGFGWNRLGFDDNELDFSQNVFQFSAGQRIKFFSIGASVKFVNTNMGLQGLFNENASGIGFDLGVLLAWPFQNMKLLKDVHFGFTFLDIADTDIKFDTGVEDEFLPMNQRFGVAWQPQRTKLFGLPSVRPTLAFEFNPDDRAHFGGEIWIENLQTKKNRILDKVALRAGLQKDIHTGEGFTYSFGGSLKLGGILKFAQIDYAYTLPPSLPATQRIGFSVSFAPVYSRVKIEKVEPEQPFIFPSLIRHYETKGSIATVSITNPRNEQIKGDLIVSASGNFYESHVIPVILPPDTTITKPFLPKFNLNSLQSVGADSQNVSYKVVFKYEYKSGLEDSTQKIGEFKQYGRNSIIWDNFRKAAAFVTSQNRTLRQFARTLIAQSGVENDNLVTAMWLFEALRVKGVRFMPDELTNWIRLPNGNLYSEDRIQFPSNLLLSEEKAGDCDDLTALYCSLLAQVGIETSLIDAPKHIFMMLDTGIPSLNSSLFPVEPGYFVKQDGRLWIPIEITDIATNFMEAWNKGREYYYLLKEIDGQVYTSNILEAWSVYPPLNFESDTTLSFSSQELRDIKTSVQEDRLKFETLRTRYVAERFGESIDKIADFQKLLERGLTLVGYGADSLTIQQARKAFQTVLDSLPNHPKALNNLGNIHFLQDSLEAAEAFYGQALSLSDTTLGIHLNLTQLYLRMIRESAVDSPDRAKYSQLFWDEISFLQKIIRTNEDVLAFFDAPTDTAKALNSRGAVGDLDFIEGEITKKISEELIWRQMFPEEDFKPGSFKKVIVELKVRPGEKYDLEDLVEASGKRGSEEESVKAKLNLASRNLTLEMVESDTMTVNLVRHTFRIGIVGEEKMKDVEFKFLLPVGVKINRSDPKYSVKRLLSRPAGRRAEKQVAMKTGYHLFWYK